MLKFTHRKEYFSLPVLLARKLTGLQVALNFKPRSFVGIRSFPLHLHHPHIYLYTERDRYTDRRERERKNERGEREYKTFYNERLNVMFRKNMLC